MPNPTSHLSSDFDWASTQMFRRRLHVHKSSTATPDSTKGALWLYVLRIVRRIWNWVPGPLHQDRQADNYHSTFRARKRAGLIYLGARPPRLCDVMFRIDRMQRYS